MKYRFAVVVGRFQPFHLAHRKLLDLAFEQADDVILALGSHRVAPTIKNPWPTVQRERMIRDCLSPSEDSRIHFVAIRDYLYNDNLWSTELQAKVREIVGDERRIAIVGHHKDYSTYYLEAFPQWALEEYTQRIALNATEIRESYFRGQNDWLTKLAPPTRKFLKEFACTPEFAALVEEQKFVDQYKQDWASAPYPPTFITVDAVVFKSGHVLVVRRRGFPGKGLFALPGGFVRQNETLERSAIRELREETGLTIPAPELRKYIQAMGVFDHPDRSLRGRTITHGFYFNLGSVGDLPPVKGGDDADKAWWMPLSDMYLNEDRFFEDHVSIITPFVNKF